MKVATITWGEEADVTKIKFSEEFVASNPIVRADVLRDVLYEIEGLYNKAVEDLGKPFDKLEKQ